MTASSPTAMFLTIVSVLILMTLSSSGVAAEREADACYVWEYTEIDVRSQPLIEYKCPPPKPMRGSLHLHQNGTHVRLTAKLNMTKCAIRKCGGASFSLVLMQQNSDHTNQSIWWRFAVPKPAEPLPVLDVKSLKVSDLHAFDDSTKDEETPLPAGNWTDAQLKWSDEFTFELHGVLSRIVNLGGKDRDLVNEKWGLMMLSGEGIDNVLETHRFTPDFLFADRSSTSEDGVTGKSPVKRSFWTMEMIIGVAVAVVGVIVLVLTLICCMCLRPGVKRRK